MSEEIIQPAEFHPIEWHCDLANKSVRLLRNGLSALKVADPKLYDELSQRHKQSAGNGLKFYYRSDLVNILTIKGLIKSKHEFKGAIGKVKTKKKLAEVRREVKAKKVKTDEYDLLENPIVPVKNLEVLSQDQKMMLMDQMLTQFQNGADDVNKLIYRYFNCTPSRFFELLHKETVLLNMWSDGVRDAKTAWATTVEMEIMKALVQKLTGRTKTTTTITYEYRTQIDGDQIKRVMVEKNRTAYVEEISPDIPTLIMAQRMVDNIKLMSNEVESKSLTQITRMPNREELAEMEQELIRDYLEKHNPDNLPPM